METKTNLEELVYYATNAPSGHNSQPWVFHIEGEDLLTLRPDFRQALPVVDKENRELYISIGCALENLTVAAIALGYSICSEVERDSGGVYQVKVKVSEGLGQRCPHDLELIETRRTNRNVFRSQTICPQKLSQLKKLELEAEVSAWFFDHESVNFNYLENKVLEGNEIQINDKPFKKELLSWMRFNKRQVRQTGNGLSFKVMDAPTLPRRIGKGIVRIFLTPKNQNRSDRVKIESASHLLLFTTKHNSAEEWIALGRSLERMLLKIEDLGIASSFMNQPCELDALSEHLRVDLPIDNGYPTILIRIGYADRIKARSPRKPVKETIISS